MTTVSGAPGRTLEPAPYRWRWAALFVVLAAEVMDLLDALITTIAGPTIVRDLGGGDTLIQWLSAAYTLAMATGLLIGGRLGDIYGRKRMFSIGMAGFTVFSALCASATSPGMLVICRVLQGLFGAMLLPQGLGVIKEVFPPKEVAKAFGMFGPIMGLSAVGGPILAGWLVDADLFGLGWRAIFAINVPIGLAAVLAAQKFLPTNRPRPTLKLDLPGVVLAAAGMFLLVYPLVQGREHDWPAWCFLMLVGAVVAFIAFAVLEIRRDRKGRPTLVVPSLFAKRAFTGGLLTGLAFFSALMGVGLVFTLFVQYGLGFSPLKAGLAGLPQAIGMMAGFGVAQALNAKLGRRLMLIGSTVVALGMVGFVLTISWAGAGIGLWSMAPALFVVGIGMGMTMAPFFDIVLAGVDDDESGSASGTLTAVQQIGGAVGVAALGTIFFSALGHSSASTQVGAFGGAAQATMWAAAGLVAISFLLTFLLPKHARPQHNELDGDDLGVPTSTSSPTGGGAKTK
ncbi:MFS transporter [Nakamurella lactea]|uniref:MFS transporter n=1 Tax=Nakamurella lactea TaxID=459515 RepID=UPI0003FCDBC6|nr:MFS transporter [Nakamurella lactea]